MTSDRTGIGNNVVSVTVANDVCCGCGNCAGVCPQDNLEMHWSAQGELVPLKKNTCAPHCRVCLSVCPFSGVGKNQDEIATQRFHDTMGVRFCEPKQVMHAVMPVERKALMEYVGREETVDYSLQMLALKGAEEGLFCMSALNGEGDFA